MNAMNTGLNCKLAAAWRGVSSRLPFKHRQGIRHFENPLISGTKGVLSTFGNILTSLLLAVFFFPRFVGVLASVQLWAASSFRIQVRTFSGAGLFVGSSLILFRHASGTWSKPCEKRWLKRSTGEHACEINPSSLCHTYGLVSDWTPENGWSPLVSPLNHPKEKATLN